MKKIMILTDSCGLPRSFPENAKTSYEETYPYLLEKEYPKVDCFKQCLGGAAAPDLIGQAIAYFDNWKPDLIIIQAGMTDCRPEPVSNFTRIVLTEFDFLHRFKAYIFRPSIMKRLIRFSAKYRVSPTKFKRNIRKIQAVFPNSKIYWLEIFTSASGGYEEHRPGVLKRIAQFNEIIQKTVKSGFIPIHNELNASGGVNADHLHLNAKGHRKIFEIIKTKIENEFGKQKINE
jgi:lysophospholipase L1-like esterase